HLHGATALLAYPIRPFRLNRPDAPLVVAREIHGVLAVGIAAAGEELPPPPPLDDHRLAALLAHEVRGALLAFPVAHLDLGLLEVLCHRLPETAHRLAP